MRKIKHQNKYLTRESFERAIKKMEEDAEWELRNPRVCVFHPEDIKKLRKLGFFKVTKNEKDNSSG